ncbi:MAG: hypothetical protein HGA61_04910 [Candidatus Moranbacteria bacterium]|nr:hypothetical protein [Candidatus Moranbacteria bacterium]
MSRKLVITSTFSGGACDASMVLNLLQISENDFRRLDFVTGLCFTVNGKEEQIENVVRMFLPGFPGKEKILVVNETTKGRGPCFIAGIRNALEMIGDDESAVIITADLCGKAPHDPRLFRQYLEILKDNPDRAIVGSTLYDSSTIDDGEMRTMGYYQWIKFGAVGDPFNIQSPALIIGSATFFKEALRLYDVYVDNYSNYTTEPWPGPGVPGLILCLLSFVGAKLYGVTLPVFGEWRPSRTWEQLIPHMKATILHAEVAEAMEKDGLFDF